VPGALAFSTLTPALAPAWDEFVRLHDDGWFWHTSAWIEYQRHYRAGNRDASFAIVDEDTGSLLGVVPLMISRATDGTAEFSYSGDPIATGLAHDPAVAEFGARHTLALVAEHDVRRARLASSPFGSPAVLVLPECPPIETPYNAAHRIVDLRAEPCALWHGVRRSYRSLIHRAEGRYTVTVYAGDSAATVAGFAAYQALHRQLATLPRAGETYRLQGEWLLDGRALLVIAEDASGVLGAAYWFVYKRAAYYASGAYAVDNLAHALVWRSLLALRELGVEQSSLGWQGVARAEKERNVEFQKRGFGGADVPAQVIELTFTRAAKVGA